MEHVRALRKDRSFGGLKRIKPVISILFSNLSSQYFQFITSFPSSLLVFSSLAVIAE